jgi:hypothetical protein
MSYQFLITEYGATIGGAIAILSGVGWFLRKLRAFSKQFDDFLEDWRGEKARPGVPERPGIMQRLSSQDKTLSDISARLATVESEVGYGNGKSIKDTVHRVDGALKHMRTMVDGLNDRVSAIEAKGDKRP